MISRRHLELKISYYYQLLKEIPHGYFGTNKGKRTVTVYYIPGDPEVSYSKNKRYYTESDKGRVWSEKIRQYINVKSEYDRLLGQWKEIYLGAPNMDAYSAAFHSSSEFGIDFWEKSVPGANALPRKSEVVFQGQRMRSKNELAACQLIDGMGYSFKTEVEVRLAVTDKNGDSYEVLLYPDIVFWIPELNRVLFIEIDGMMDREGYLLKSEQRRRDYLNGGLVEGVDVIFYRIAKGEDLDIERLENLIDAAIETNISRALQLSLYPLNYTFQ